MMTLGRETRRFAVRPGRIAQRAGRIVARGCVGLATLVFVAQSLGLQIAPTGGKDLRVPFPCMHSRCGCQNAEQCWRGCCCQTLGQRLAWARQNNIEPPRFVLEREADLEDTAATKQATIGGSAKSCCGSKKSCCAKSPPAAKSVAAKCVDTTSSETAKRACCSHRHSTARAPVALVEAFRCHGSFDNWIGMSPTLAPVILSHALNQPLIAWTAVESNRPDAPHTHPPLRPPAA